MRFFPIASTVSLLALSTLGSALGINCQGSSRCSKGALQNIVNTALSNTGGCSATPGQQMYCDGNICAFTQGTRSNIDPDTAQVLLTALLSHGCQGCGSIPLEFPFSNDPSNGILTVNFVSDNHGCNGICIPQC
jgi:hypothetical protein